MFGKVKTIVLPGNLKSEKTKYTIDEYKEAFGIDLRELLVLKDSQINLNPKVFENAQILVEFATITGAVVLCPAFPDPESIYASGETDGVMKLMYVSPSGNYGAGLRFEIPMEETFDISNLLISIIEL